MTGDDVDRLDGRIEDLQSVVAKGFATCAPIGEFRALQDELTRALARIRVLEDQIDHRPKVRNR